MKCIDCVVKCVDCVIASREMRQLRREMRRLRREMRRLRREMRRLRECVDCVVNASIASRNASNASWNASIASWNASIASWNASIASWNASNCVKCVYFIVKCVDCITNVSIASIASIGFPPHAYSAISWLTSDITDQTSCTFSVTSDLTHWPNIDLWPHYIFMIMQIRPHPSLIFITPHEYSAPPLINIHHPSWIFSATSDITSLEGSNVTQQRGGAEYSWWVMNINEGWRWIFMRGDEY